MTKTILYLSFIHNIYNRNLYQTVSLDKLQKSVQLQNCSLVLCTNQTLKGCLSASSELLERFNALFAYNCRKYAVLMFLGVNYSAGASGLSKSIIYLTTAFSRTCTVTNFKQTNVYYRNIVNYTTSSIKKAFSQDISLICTVYKVELTVSNEKSEYYYTLLSFTAINTVKPYIYKLLAVFCSNAFGRNSVFVFLPNTDGVKFCWVELAASPNLSVYG